MALKNTASVLYFKVINVTTGTGVSGLSVGGGSFSSIKLDQDNVLSSDIKGDIALVDKGNGRYAFSTSATQMNYGVICPVIVCSNASYEAHGVVVYTETAIRASDIIAELVSDPGATPTFINALMLLYMKARNEETTTDSAKTVKNSAGATILTHTVSDNGTTFTKSKVA